MRNDGFSDAAHRLLAHGGAVAVLEDGHKGPQGLVLMGEAGQLRPLGAQQQLGHQLAKSVHGVGSHPGVGVASGADEVGGQSRPQARPDQADAGQVVVRTLDQALEGVHPAMQGDRGGGLLMGCACKMFASGRGFWKSGSLGGGTWAVYGAWQTGRRGRNGLIHGCTLGNAAEWRMPLKQPLTQPAAKAGGGGTLRGGG